MAAPPQTMTTILPERFSTRRGSTARTEFTTPRRLISRVSAHSLGRLESRGPTGRARRPRPPGRRRCRAPPSSDPRRPSVVPGRARRRAAARRCRRPARFRAWPGRVPPGSGTAAHAGSGLRQPQRETLTDAPPRPVTRMLLLRMSLKTSLSMRASHAIVIPFHPSDASPAARLALRTACLRYDRTHDRD